jgi:hypothetical protein
MVGLKDAFWLVMNVFATICALTQAKLEEYAARKCREYVASLAQDS